MYKDKDDGGGKPYDLTEEEWEAMSVEEKQKFFDMFRARVHAFWQAHAKHQMDEAARRAEQKSRFKVDEPLE